MKEIKTANKFLFDLLVYQIIMGFVLHKVDLSGKYFFLFQIIFLFTPILFYFWSGKNKFLDVVKIKKISGKNIFLLILFGFTIQPVMSFFSCLGTLFAKNLNQQLVLNLVKHNLLIAIFFVAFLPALFEEIIFRGIFFFGYKKTQPISKAFFVNALSFAVLHMSYQQFFYAFIMGLIFCAMDFYMDSILPSILVHFIFNATQILKAYIFLNRKNFYFADLFLFDFEINNLFCAFFIAISFLPISIFLFYQITKTQNKASVNGDKKYIKEGKEGKIFTWHLVFYLVLCFLCMR